MKKTLLSMMFVFMLVFSTHTAVFGQSVKNGEPVIDDEILAAYENVVDYAEKNRIPLDLSLETFIEEYESSNYTSIADYENSYYKVLVRQPATRVGSNAWYYNTGTTLPQAADYSRYNLLNTLKKGDIIFEPTGFYGLTGHIAVVEGKFYDSKYQQYYIRVVEANIEGVARGVLDDSRVDEREAVILRVAGATDLAASKATDFCLSQIGKGYMIDFSKDTSPNEPDWYCSELCWAGYKIQGYDIETTAFFNEPGVTPRDIRNSSGVYSINFK